MIWRGDIRRVLRLVAIIDASPASFAALEQLVSNSARVALFTVQPVVPPDPLKIRLAKTAEQMVAMSVADTSAMAVPEPVLLRETDVPAMLELVELTKPRPVRCSYRRLGNFLGIRADNRLVAMAGERMKLDGFTEITAVCTHPAYRGKGYARALLQAVSTRSSSRVGEESIPARVFRQQICHPALSAVGICSAEADAPDGLGQRRLTERAAAKLRHTIFASNGGCKSGASNSTTQMSGSNWTCFATYASTVA